MSKRMFGLVAAAIAWIACVPAHAADISFHPKEDDIQSGYVTIDGEIREGDAAKIRRIIATKTVTTVFLESEGGSLPEALEIGRMINVSGYRTVVMDDTVCASSCALIWLAGNPRYMQPRALVGFHASYTMEGGKPIASGVANAVVGRYLTLLNLPSKAVMFATSASPDDMSWINAKDPGGEGIAYILSPSSKEQPESHTAQSATQPATGSQNIPARAQTITGKKFADGTYYGKWRAVVTATRVGIGSLSTNNKGYLVFSCPEGAACRFLLNLEKKCEEGDAYELTYEVEGYNEKTVRATCNLGGEELTLSGATAFDLDITDETFITFHVVTKENTKDDVTYPLVGYRQAVEAMLGAGYMKNGIGIRP